jgi:hypothetical protein
MSIQSPTIEELHDAALMVAQLMQKEGCETLAKQHHFGRYDKDFQDAADQIKRTTTDEKKGI